MAALLLHRRPVPLVRLLLLLLVSTTSLSSAFVTRAPLGISPRRLISRQAEDQMGAVDSARQKISDALTPTELSVTAAFDDPNGSHITIDVVSDKFEGVSRVKRQQMVYKAIWEEMQGAIHAVDSMTCKTPEEAK